MKKYFDIFISYSRHDVIRVTQIKNELERETQSSCWMDLDGIESGEQFVNVIISAINRCNTVLFMMSEHSMNSEWALDELDFAKKKKKRVVLVAIEDVEITDIFYFQYHKYDQIEWNNQHQREKLIRDVKKWIENDEAERLKKKENRSVSGGEFMQEHNEIPKSTAEETAKTIKGNGSSSPKLDVVKDKSIKQNSIFTNWLEKDSSIIPSLDLDEPLWDKLVQQIIDGNVIPVIGPDFLTDDEDNPHKLIVDFLAEGFHVDSHPKSFSELIYNRNYMIKNKKDNIYYQVNQILAQATFNPSPLLIELLATRQFPFVITTSFTPIVEQAMRNIWKDELRIMRFNNNPSEMDDVKNAMDLREPTVYYMFGKVGEGAHKYVLTDNDMINYVSSWLPIDNRNKPRILCHELKQKYLLFLGNNYSDWLFRFICHSMQGEYNRNRMYVSDSIDDSLLNYLERTETFIQLNTEETITKLILRLNKELRKNEETKFKKPEENQDVYISYSRSDSEVANKLYTALTAQGIRVWYDRNNLTDSGNYMEEIRRAIRTAKYFIPILSDSIRREKTESHLYRYEWDTAIEVAISMGRTYIVPLAEEGFDFYTSAIPERMQQCNSLFYSRDEDMAMIAEKLVYLMNKDR